MKKLIFILMVCVATVTTANAFERCDSFTIINHLDRPVVLKKDPSSTAFCNVPLAIAANNSGKMTIRRETNQKTFPAYLAIDSIMGVHRYAMFAQFLVAKTGERFINLELLNPTSAYSWSSNNDTIALCSSDYYTAHGYSCW